MKKGARHTAEAKAKVAAANRGKKRTPEQRERIAAATSVGRKASLARNLKAEAAEIRAEKNPDRKARLIYGAMKREQSRAAGRRRRR